MHQIYQDTSDNTYVGIFEGKVTKWGTTPKEMLEFFKHEYYRSISPTALLGMYEDELRLVHETETIEELKLLILLES